MNRNVLAARGASVVRLRVVRETRRRQAGPEEAGGPDPLIDLVRRIGAGDQQAMADLYDATRAMIFGLALKIVDDYSAAEDVTIEVYSQAWRQAERFSPQKGCVTAWLFTITRSRAIDALRARHRRPKASAIEDEAERLRTEESGPAEATIESERGRMVRQALGRLTPLQRESIELAFFSELSHSEIADRLQQPLGTVKTRIRDGMLKLREMLSAIEQTPERRQA